KLNVKIQYSLNENKKLTIHCEAITDRPTPVNLANHSYFNLSGFETPDILNHLLQINSQRYTETECDIPTGKSLALAGTRYDFSVGREIGDTEADAVQGYNQNFIINGYVPGKVTKAARLWDKESG